MDKNTAPQEFDVEEHLASIRHSRYKRQSAKRRYVLFILDNSGSIGAANFNTMVKSLSKLAPLFCGNALFAVMTYDDIMVREFCFDSCDQLDRINGNLVAGAKLFQAIASVQYRNGPKTRSGDAIKCACTDLLHYSCGFYNEPTSLIDVIFLTDGQSNRGENVCTATRCLNVFPKERVGVVTIGVGDKIDYNELNCIKGDRGANSHIFDVANSAQLDSLLTAVVNNLNSTQRICQQCCNPL